MLAIALCGVPQGVAAALALMPRARLRRPPGLHRKQLHVRQVARLRRRPAGPPPHALDMASLFALQMLDLLGCLALLMGAGEARVGTGRSVSKHP